VETGHNSTHFGIARRKTFVCNTRQASFLHSLLFINPNLSHKSSPDPRTGRTDTYIQVLNAGNETPKASDQNQKIEFTILLSIVVPALKIAAFPNFFPNLLLISPPLPGLFSLGCFANCIGGTALLYGLLVPEEEEGLDSVVMPCKDSRSSSHRHK
jgi:hypothetical protein